MRGLARPVPLRTAKIKRATFRKRKKSNKVIPRLASYNLEEIHPTEYEKCLLNKKVTSVLEIVEYDDL